MLWDDLKTILAISRAGSLAGAGELLGVNHTTVFRHINAIEKTLKVRFFERLPTGYVLTDEGESAVKAAQDIEERVSEFSRELLGKDTRLQGTIRITAAEGVSLHLLTPCLAKFTRLHPDIHIDLIVTSSALELSKRLADIAVRVTARPPDLSIGRKICDFRFGFYASKKYIQENQHKSLGEHSWILTDDSSAWFPQSIWKKFSQIQSRVSLSSNSTQIILDAVKRHMGVAPLPCFLGDAETSLRRIISPPDELVLQLWLLTHPDLRNSTRIRTLLDFLHAELSTKQDLISGKHFR
ncbi:MAG: LysR family transcriptional regulator [Gammaproteobacteria bacterium]|nr:LysR family transcriptional regulator [Gammaproteobacteria bacterium]